MIEKLKRIKDKNEKKKKLIYSWVILTCVMSVILLFLLFILLPLNDNNNNKHNKPIYINETTILNEQYAIKPDTLIYFDDSDISKSANITLLDCQKISDAYGGSTNFIINDDHFITFGFLISPTMNFYLSAINNSFCNININNENAFNSDTPFFAFAVGSLSKFDGVFRGNINIDKSVKIYINNIISDETFILSATFCVFYFNSIGSHSLIDIKGIFNIHSTSINIYGIYIANTIEKDSVQNINGCFKCVSNYDASTMRTIYNDELLTSLKQERAIFNLSSCIFINQSFGLTNINGIFFIKGYEGSIAHVKKMGVTAKFNMNGIFNILSTIGNVAGVIFGDFQNLDNILDGQISIGGIFSIECSLNGGCSSAIHIVNRTQKTWQLILNIKLVIDASSCAVIYFDNNSMGSYGCLTIHGLFILKTHEINGDASIIYFTGEETSVSDNYLDINMTNDVQVITNSLSSNGSNFFSHLFPSSRTQTYMWNLGNMSSENQNFYPNSPKTIILKKYYSNSLSSTSDWHISFIWYVSYESVERHGVDSTLEYEMMKNNIKNIMIQYIDYLNEYVLNDFISVAETQEIHMIINELISDIPNSKNLYIDDNTIKNSDFCIHAGSHIYVGNNEQIQTANDLLDIQAIVEETGSYNITITSNITYGLLISPTMYANISMLNDNLICAPTIKNDKGDASAFGIVVGKKSQNFNDSYSGDFLIVNNNFNCSISTTLAKPYGVYIKSIASNVYIGIDKSSFSIYAKYNNAYGMYIKTTKSKSLNISGLWTIKSEIYSGYGCYIQSIEADFFTEAAVCNVFAFFCVSGNAEAYGFYCESITKSRLFINNSYFSLAAKKNICAIYVKNALTYSISITENSGSLIATGLESTSVVLSLFTFYDLHPKSIYYQNNRFLFSCNYINGRATAIELDPYSNLQDMNFLDGNVFVSSTKDNGYLADRMYVIDYGSLWNTDGYIGMFNNRSNTECVHLKTVFYESKPIFASTSIFIALITTCSNYNYNISVQYNQSLYEMNMFNDIQKQTFFPKLWMPNINDLIFEAYASFITTIQS